MFYVLPICLDVSCKSCALIFHKYNIAKREKILVWIWNFNYRFWSLFDAFFTLGKNFIHSYRFFLLQLVVRNVKIPMAFFIDMT
jgi:hypothetical protein